MVLGLNIGFWSSDCELWFQSQAQQILQKTATIKSARAWTVALKYEKPRTLKLINYQEAIASKFLSAPDVVLSLRYVLQLLNNLLFYLLYDRNDVYFVLDSNVPKK